MGNCPQCNRLMRRQDLIDPVTKEVWDEWQCTGCGYTEVTDKKRRKNVGYEVKPIMEPIEMDLEVLHTQLKHNDNPYWLAEKEKRRKEREKEMNIRFYTNEDYEKRDRQSELPFIIDVKRLYLPIIIEGKCPQCNAEYERDLNDAYLSYPKVNVPEPFTCWCLECRHEWQIVIQLNVSLELVKGEEEKS
jgi:hypothetical protein